MKTDDIAKMSQLSLYAEALKLHLGQQISPRMAIVHPSNKCNHRCTGCEYTGVHPAEIESERLLELIDEIADLGAASILFSGGGEPTMHPVFAEALKKATQRGLLVGVFTNGSIIDEERATHIAEHAAFIRISMDAASSETYSAIRGVGASAFDKTLSAVKKLVAIKTDSKSTLEIGLKFLVRKTNIEEIADFIALADHLGVDNVQFKPLRQAADEPTAEDIQQVRQILKESGSTHPRLKIRGKMTAKIQVPVPCWLSPLRLVTSAEGDVHICNYFNHRRATHTFGNIYQKPLKETWFSAEHRHALGNIKPHQCTFFDCRFHKLNAELLELVKHHRHQLDFV